MSKKIQRPISILTSITTIAWLSGIAMLAPLSVGAAIVDGDIVSPDAEFTEGEITYYPYDVFIVKIVGSKTFKRLILNPEVFESYGHLEWGNIQTISADTVDGYTTSDLVRELNDTKVYKLTPDGDVGTKAWMNMTAAEFEADGYDWDSIYVINVTDRDNYTTGSDVGDGVVSEGTLTVTLAADTPATKLVPYSAARVPFTKVTLTASGGDVIVDSLTMQRAGTAQDVNFDSFCVIDVETNEKIGLDKTLNSLHQATLKDDITVASGTSKSIILAGNMGGSTAVKAGEIPAISLVAMVLKGDATLNVTLPIVGNTMTMNATLEIATVTLAEGSSNPSADNEPKIGDTDIAFVEIKLSNNSKEIVEVDQIKFTQYGSAADSDIENIDLVDSVTNEVLATLENLSGGIALFKFDSPLTIAKGKHKYLMVRGDTIGGSDRTVRLCVEKLTDVLVKGQLYGFYVTPAAGTSVQSTEPRFGATDKVYEQTIGKGTLKVSEAAIAASNIAEADQQVIGAFDFTAKGEAVNISQIGVKIATSSDNTGTAGYSAITNVSIYDSNGNVIAGPTNLSSDYTATSSDTFTVPVGVSTYTVKADLSTAFSADDEIYAEITPGANITARGDSTGKSITATPASAITSVIQTIKAGTLSIILSTTPTSTNVVEGAKQYHFADVILDASGSGEDMLVNKVQVRLTTTNGYSNYLSNFKLYDGETELDIIGDPDTNLAGNATARTIPFSLSETMTITKGTSNILSVKADISRSCAAGNVFQVGVDATNAEIVALGAESATSDLSYTDAVGASMTIKVTGEFTVYSSGSLRSSLITADTSKVTVGVFSVTAMYEDINVEKIYFTATSTETDNDQIPADTNQGGLSQVATFYVFDGSDELASVVPTSSDGSADSSVLVDMTNTPAVVAAGETKDFTIKIDTADISIYGGTTGAAGDSIRFSIASTSDVYAKGASSGVVIDGTEKTVSCTMKQFTLFKSVPTVTLNEDLGDSKVVSGSLTAGTESGKPLYRFMVTADEKGAIGLYRVQFLVSTSTATVTSFYLFDETGKVATASSTADIIDDGEGGTGYQGVITFYFTDDGLVPDAEIDASSNIVPYTIAASGSQTFTFKGDTECTSDCQSTSRTGSVQTQLLGDSSWPRIVTTYVYPDGADDLNDDIFANSFIWSDFSITGSISSTTASTSEQWMNGYRLPSGGGGNIQATSTSVTFSK